MPWCITQCHDKHLTDINGTTGPGWSNMTADQIISHPEAKRWRTKDGDGNVDCEGYLIGDEFAPLDHFCEPSLGSAAIEVMEDGEWLEV